jgi:hypothetical protein
MTGSQQLIIPSMDGFSETFMDCFTSCYSRMLRGHRLPPQVLGDAWGYWYLPQQTGWPLDHLWMTTRPPNEVIQDWFGISENLIRHDSPRSAWQYVEAVINAGDVPAVTIDLYHHPASSFFQSRHYAHRVVVSGYRDDAVFVLDNGGMQSFADWMPRAQLLRAMSAEELVDGPWNYDGRNVTVDLPAPDLALREPPVHRWLATLGDNARRDPAERALLAFGADLVSYAGTSPELSDEVFMAGVVSLGTVTSMRKLNALFVEEAALRTGLDLGVVADGLHEASRQWNRLLHALLFGHRSGRGLRFLLKQAEQRIDQIMEIERRIATELAQQIPATF